MENENTLTENTSPETLEQDVVTGEGSTLTDATDTGVEPDKNIEENKEEVKETTSVDVENDNPTIDEYANKYDAMVQENEELKSKLAESDNKYAELEATIKTLQEGMAKLRKANEFASSSSSIQQNQRVGGMASAEDILMVRSKI